MDVGPAGAALIWAHLLLPTHWPLLAAGAGTLYYRRRIKSRGKFFLTASILGYGMQGLVSIPWPLVWMTFFDGKSTDTGYAAYYIYFMALLSLLLTLVAMHLIATKFWNRLFP